MDLIKRDLLEVLAENYHALRISFNTVMYHKYKKYYKLSDGVKFDGWDITLIGEGEIQIGDGTYIGSYTRLSTDKDYIISIGKNCAISHMVSIYTSNRKPEVITNPHNITYSYGNVIIGDNCLLGIGSTIMQGVNIGNNCFIGAGAVVTKDIPEYSVVGGVPARIINTIEH